MRSTDLFHRPGRRLCGRAALALGAILALAAAPARAPAQPMMPSDVPQSPPPNSQIYQRVGIDQKLNAQLPLDLSFRDEAGKTVKLGDYFHHGRPVVLSLVYYKCPMLCTATLNGMVSTFKVLDFNIGHDFDVVTVSFDPREGPDLAAKKKKSYLKDYHRAGAENGWHFLTGDAEPIQRLTQAVGFRYFYDPRTDQYAHASAIMLVTPDGKLSRYFYGIDYGPKDMRLGLVEASQGKIGTLADAVTLLCYHYDPMTGKYGFAVVSALRIGGLLTMALLGGSIYLMSRSRKRELAAMAAGAVPAEPVPAGAAPAGAESGACGKEAAGAAEKKLH